VNSRQSSQGPKKTTLTRNETALNSVLAVERLSGILAIEYQFHDDLRGSVAICCSNPPIATSLRGQQGVEASYVVVFLSPVKSNRCLRYNLYEVVICDRLPGPSENAFNDPNETITIVSRSGPQVEAMARHAETHSITPIIIYSLPCKQTSVWRSLPCEKAHGWNYEILLGSFLY